MNDSIKQLSNSEIQLMNVIWSKNADQSSKEIIEATNQNNSWSKSTTLTIISRLKQKGYLTSYKKNRTSFYNATIAKENYMKFQSEKLIGQMNSSSIKNLFISLFNTNSISKNDIQELLELLKGKESL